MSEKQRKHELFVDYVIQQINRENKGFRAKLSKSSSLATEYHSWEILAPWVNLEHELERRAYGLIGASLANSRPTQDGTLGLGQALYFAHKDKLTTDKSEIEDKGSPRLRRILASRDPNDLLVVLRSMLRLLESKNIQINYSKLLGEILGFQFDSSRERTLAKWAQEYYGNKENVE